MGSCQKGDMCPYPHLDGESVTRIENAERRQKGMHKDLEKAVDCGRSPSGEKKGKKWRKNSVGSE